MPTRLILSAYAGPMPRPVVPIFFLPRKRSVTLSTVEWYDAITWALALTTSGPIVTSRSISASSSRNSASGETTTPLAITEVQPGVRMPLGSRWVANFSPLTTIVCPALWPPLVRTQKSMASSVVSRSVALPLPSSPHWAPSTTIAGMSLLRARRPEREAGRDGADVGRSRRSGRAHRTACAVSAKPRPGCVTSEGIPPVLRIPSTVTAWTPFCSSPTPTPEVGDRRDSTLPWGCSGRTPTSRSPPPATPVSSTACSTAPGVVRSWSRVATAACTRSSRRCIDATSSPSARSG